jgi:hypothetical protein
MYATPVRCQQWAALVPARARQISAIFLLLSPEGGEHQAGLALAHPESGVSFRLAIQPDLDISGKADSCPNVQLPIELRVVSG